MLKTHYYPEQAPAGYSLWLDRNLSHFDPVARAWRMRGSAFLASRPHPSFKCWDDRCLHYVYGFPTADDRDSHVREHALLSKRDSGLSVGNTPPMVFPGADGMHTHNGSRTFSLGNDHSKQSSPTIYLPRPSLGSKHGGGQPVSGLAGSVGGSISGPSQPGPSKGDRRSDMLLSYSFGPEHPPGSSRQPRGSVDSEVDPLNPLLPPLRESRTGHSRLLSIEELRLLNDLGPCLRCKVLKKAVRLSSRSCSDSFPRNHAHVIS